MTNIPTSIMAAYAIGSSFVIGLAYNYDRRQQAFYKNVHSVIGNYKTEYESPQDEMSRLPGFRTPLDSSMAFSTFNSIADNDSLTEQWTRTKTKSSFIHFLSKNYIEIRKGEKGNILLKNKLSNTQ